MLHSSPTRIMSSLAYHTEYVSSVGHPVTYFSVAGAYNR